MVTNSTEKKINQLVKISKYHYIDGLSQVEIAKKLHLSRPTISRALQTAKETGLVQIKINDPLTSTATLQKQLKEKYDLKDVIISTDTNDDENIITQKLGEKAAEYLNTIVQDNDTVGISWGNTLHAVAIHLKPSDKQNVSIVHLKGSMANAGHDNFSADITTRFSRAFHTDALILPLPVIFDRPQIKSIVIKDRFIADTLQKGYDANIAIYTVGTTRPTAMLFNLGYLTEAEISYLRKHSVGDIDSHFVDENAQIVDQSLDDRTVAISLAQLQKKTYSILVAGGEAKIAPMKVALRAHYANVLITDIDSAQALLLT